MQCLLQVLVYRHLGCFYYLLLWIILLSTFAHTEICICVWILPGHVFVSFGYIPISRIARSFVTLYLRFWGTDKLFSKVYIQSKKLYDGFNFSPHYCQYFLFTVIFSGHLVDKKVTSYGDFDLHFCTNDSKHLFPYLVAICMFSLGKIFKWFAYVLIRLFILLLFICKSALCSGRKCPLLDNVICKCIFLSCVLSFHFLDDTFYKSF